jgi:hypothetical protein
VIPSVLQQDQTQNSGFTLPNKNLRQYLGWSGCRHKHGWCCFEAVSGKSHVPTLIFISENKIDIPNLRIDAYNILNHCHLKSVTTTRFINTVENIGTVTSGGGGGVYNFAM